MRLRDWKWSLAFVVYYLCSHAATSSNHRSLLAPVSLATKVIGDKVKVHWKDHNQPELLSGAYAAVSEVNGDQLGSPVFIHAEDVKTKSITLSGLMPQMTYSIRVVLFSKDGYSVSSSPVTITMNSYLDEAQPDTDSQVVIEVNHITQVSAMLSWKFPVTHSIHGLQFKLNCNGQQTFIMNGRTVHETYQTKSYISDALSKYTQEQVIEDLVPNVNYTCELATYNAASKKTFPMATAHFTTLVGKPRNPEKPRVDSNNNGIKIFLTATPNQFGPISYYTLIAVPVHKDKTQPITSSFTPLIPYNKVVGKAIPSHSASKSDKSLAFIIGTYPGNALPSEVVLGNTNEVLSAFKPNQYYVVVLAAFTKSKENPKSLFSLSSPSFPPFVINNLLYMHVSQYAEEEAVGEASRAVLWIMGAIAFFGIAIIMSFIGVTYVLKKRGYKIALKWSDEDEDIGSEDYLGLKADKLVYGEKTYIPMKPLTSAHTQQSTRVASETTIKFDNTHFSTSVNRTKGLLEDIQVAVDCPEASAIVENPPHSPNENSQPPRTCTVRNTENPPARSNKNLNRSPFTYSTPEELEKLKAGTFSLPRSTGPIRTPRRRAAAVTKSPLNRGIPTPAPCKPTTVNNEKPPVTATFNEESNINEESGNTNKEPLTMATVNKEESPTTDNTDEESALTTIDKDPPTAANIEDEPPTVATIEEEPLMTIGNNEKLLTMANIEEEPPTVADIEEKTLTAEEPLTTGSNDKLLAMANTEEKPPTMADIEEKTLTVEEPLITGNNDKLLSMANTEEEPPTVANIEEPLTTGNNENLLTTANIDEEQLTANDEQQTMLDTNKDPPAIANLDEKLPTTCNNDEQPLTMATIDEESLATTNNEETSVKANKNQKHEPEQI